LELPLAPALVEALLAWEAPLTLPIGGAQVVAPEGGVGCVRVCDTGGGDK
jgi:hypothetical protein